MKPGEKMSVSSLEIVECFQQAETDQQINELRQHIIEQGYSAFNELLDYVKQQLKKCEESNWQEMLQHFEKARKMIPRPGSISPSWEYVWEEIESFITHKQEVLRKVPLEQRDGEWQVIMDNPYTNEHIVCYPGLSFIEAAYLYAYFRPGLKKNEYIRVQKVIHLVESEGN